MKSVQDIHYDDLSLKNEFVQKFISGNISEAFNILDQNKQLEDKKFVAENINDYSNAILELENKYDDGVNVYLTNKNNEFDELIWNFINKEDYNINNTYQKYNFVLYIDNIYMYINDKPSTGKSPINTIYWLKLGLHGETGGYGVGIKMKYQWNSQASYSPLDAVIYNGVYYVSKTSNTGSIPSDSSADWVVFVKTKPAYIATDASESNLANGMIWFEINGGS